MADGLRCAFARALLPPLLVVGLAACSAPGPVVDELGAELLALVNEARAEPRGCGARGEHDAAAPLALEARLMRAARSHSADMFELQYFGHTGADGSSPSERVTREGYDWAAVGETIARGFATPEAVVDAWLASDGHCAVLMYPRFAELGAGEEGRYWTLVFARSQ